MADPLSITASTITLLAACTACVKHLNGLARSFRYTLEEILALSNEINNISIVMMKLKAVFRDPAMISELVAL